MTVDYTRRTEAEQEDFFFACREAALSAQARAGCERVVLQVARRRIAIHFAGPALRRALLPALQHLVIEGEATPDVVFHLWDSASTGVPVPQPPCPRDHLTDRGDIWGFVSERFRAAFHWIECSVNTMDLQRGEATFWVQDPETLPYWTKASPLRTLFHWTMEQAGAQLLHAAAVGDESGAVLITGKGGVGKSTTALTCLDNGMFYVGDDYLIVGLDPEAMVYSLYGTAKLNADQMQRFPSLAAHVTNLPAPDGEKAVLRLFPAVVAQIAPAMKLRAVLTPRIVPQTRTDFAPIEAEWLRRAASFTTMSQLPYAGQRTHLFINRMIEAVPRLEIRLGSDLAGVAAAVRGLLGRSDAVIAAFAAAPETETAAAKARPLISVIVPVYNGASFLAEAVGNVLSQRYPALEIIIVDDGSKDAIEEAVAALPVDVRFFRQENAGPAAARNRGIRDASGDFIAFLDVDDLWPARNLELLVDYMLEHPELMVVRGHAQLMTLNADTGAYEYTGDPSKSFPHYIGAALYRRAAFETIGLFDEDLFNAEDTDWFTRLAESGLAQERLPQVTLFVRRHGGNMTANKSAAELNQTALAAFKKSLDRRRAQAAAAMERHAREKRAAD